MTAWLRALDRGVAVDVLVQPRASRPKVGPVHGDRLKLAVTSPPVDGEANAAVLELLADVLDLPRSALTLIAGASSRRKTIRVDGLSVETVQEKLAP
ncbi:MAG: DUF167 domain-containing protein [Kofleriaceae bacterium]